MTAADRFAIPALPERFPSVCPVSGLPIRTRPEWVYTNPGNTYRTTFALIGVHIFWVIPRGYVTEADMQQAIDRAAAVLAEVRPDDTPFVFIENFAYTKAGTAGARRLYLNFTNTLKGLLGAFPYGLPPFFRLSFNFSRRLHLHRYKVHMVARYEDAVRSALEMLEHYGIASPAAGVYPSRRRPAEPTPRRVIEPTGDPAGDVSVKGLSAHVERLLDHLGHLDLKTPGIPETPDMAQGSAMEPVYETLVMLKMDMDQFLEEHRCLMDALQENHQALLRQTEANEARNRELQTLLQKTHEDQKHLGAIARRNVQTLLKPLVALIEQDARLPVQREWIDGLNDRIDDLTRDLVPQLDLNGYRLTPQEIIIARLIRDGAQSKAIARQLGLSVRTIETFRSRLREKLGLRGRPRNLRTALLAIPDNDRGSCPASGNRPASACGAAGRGGFPFI